MTRLGALRAGLAELVARGGGVTARTIAWRALVWRAARMLGVSIVVPVHGGGRMRLTPKRGDHGIATSIFLLRDGHEPALRAVIDAVLAPGDAAVDIGANMGLWSLRMAERVGARGRVLAAEPGAETRARLTRNLALSGMSARVAVLPVALGEAEGCLTLHTPADAGSASLGVPEGPARCETVTVRPFDAVWREAGAPDIRLVKIDVEGAEPLVLRGATAFFARCRPVVHCEVNPAALARLGFSPHDIFSFFAARGYSFHAWRHDAGQLRAFDPSGTVSPDDIVFFPPGDRPDVAI